MFFGRAEGDYAVSYDLKSEEVVDGTIAASFLGLGAEDAVGIAVGPAGDMNGDGVADLWVSLFVPTSIALSTRRAELVMCVECLHCCRRN